MDRNPVLQDLHTFHNTAATSAPNTDYQANKMTISDQDNRVMFSMPPHTNTNNATDTQTTSFLDGLDFGFDSRLYQQQQLNQQMHQQQPLPIHQHEGLYSPNQFYQMSPQQQQMQQMHQQQQQQQHYMPVYQQHPPPPHIHHQQHQHQQQQQQQQQQHPHHPHHQQQPHHPLHNNNHNNSQILLQRYNSNGSTTSSTNSQPSYLSNYSPMAHYNVSLQHQNDSNLNKMLYAQHHHQQQQQHLQQLQQPHNLQINKKRKANAGANNIDLMDEHLLQQQAGGGIQKKKTKAKKKKAPKIVDPNAPPKPKRKTGLNKPLILSPALSELMDGEKELSRPELVQKLWKYIKGNDLQDPADRRFILCDDKLKKIFDQDRINSFGMNKDLSAHLTKKEEPAIKQEDLEEGSEQQTDTTATSAEATTTTTATDKNNDTKDLNTATSVSTTASEDVATTAVACNENTNTTPLLLQQEATPSEEPIVTPKEEDFLLNL
ncbi:hypothetical protein PS15m_001979 [Mucor circinelloides]